MPNDMNVGDGFTRVAVEASRSKFKHRVVIRNGGGGTRYT